MTVRCHCYSWWRVCRSAYGKAPVVCRRQDGEWMAGCILSERESLVRRSCVPSPQLSDQPSWHERLSVWSRGSDHRHQGRSVRSESSNLPSRCSTDIADSRQRGRACSSLVRENPAAVALSSTTTVRHRVSAPAIPTSPVRSDLSYRTAALHHLASGRVLGCSMPDVHCL